MERKPQLTPSLAALGLLCPSQVSGVMLWGQIFVPTSTGEWMRISLMLSVSIVRTTDPRIVMWRSVHSSVQIAPRSTRIISPCTRATSKQSLMSAGILSRSLAFKSVETSAFMNSPNNTAMKETLSPRNIARPPPNTIDADLPLRQETCHSLNNPLRKIFPRLPRELLITQAPGSRRTMKSTKSLRRPARLVLL